MLLPDSMELRICVPFNSRSTAWASFDGRGRVELKRTYSDKFSFLKLIGLRRGRPHQNHSFEISFPDGVCRQTVD